MLALRVKLSKTRPFYEGSLLNIKQIRYFVSVFNRGSLSAAAKEQYVTVQAVSKAIADLERELKCDLFVRESRGMRPTPFGKSFYLKADSVLKSFEELEEFSTFHSQANTAPLRLALCAPPFLGQKQVCASIVSFIEKNLGLGTSVSAMLEKDGLIALRAGSVDGLIAFGAHERPGCERFAIGAVAPGVFMSKKHPLAQRKTLTVDDLKAQSVFAPRNFTGFAETIVAGYGKRGVDVPCIEFTLQDFEERIMRGNELVFALGIALFGEMTPYIDVKLMAPEDVVAVPVCLVGLAKGRSAACQAFERWLSSEALRIGGDPSSRVADMVSSLQNAPG